MDPVRDSKKPTYSSGPVPQFTYEKIDSSNGDIRLLDLHIETDNDGILCELITTNVNSGESYEALSYVWGSSDEGETITVNGSSLMVTRNLWVALAHLRATHTLRHNEIHEFKKNRRRLWIDAICINQENIEEKNSQVRMMWSIYSNAESVLVWLGEEYENSAIGMEMVRLLDWNFELQSQAMMARLLGENLEDEPSPTSDSQLDALDLSDVQHGTDRLANSLSKVKLEGERISEEDHDLHISGASSNMDENLPSKSMGDASIDNLAGLSSQIGEGSAEQVTGKGGINFFLMTERPVITANISGPAVWPEGENSSSTMQDDREHKVRSAEDYANIPFQLLMFAHGNVWHRYEDPEEWVAFQKLLERPWWQRIWTVQEVAAAPGAIWVGCGSSWLKWEAFVNAGCIIEQYRDHPFFQRLKRLGAGTNWIMERARLRLRADGRLDRWGGLLNLLHTTASYAATDPRDKIFAVLGFTPSIPLKPDYSCAVDEIYENLVKHSIRASGALSVLALNRKPKCLNLPSWVPDFSIRVLESIFNGYFPRGFYGADGNHWHFQGAASVGCTLNANDPVGKLSTIGVVYDVPLALGDTWEAKVEEQQSSLFRIIATYEQFLNDVDGSYFQRLSGTHRRECLWRTLIWNADEDGQYPAPESFSKFFDQIVQSDDNLVSGDIRADAKLKPEDRVVPRGDAERFFKAFRQYGLNRRFFVTSTGNLGSGPPDMQLEDLICVMLGSPSPVILRKVPGGHGYELIGMAYVHGIMHGEALSKAYLGAERDLDGRRQLAWQKFCLI